MKITKFELLINLWWAFPLLVLIRFLNLFINIRLCQLRSDRIGHFIFDGYEIVINKKKNIFKQLDLIWIDNEISNQQWKKMILREISVYSFLKYVAFLNQRVPFRKIKEIPGSFFKSRDINGLFNKNKIQLNFLKEEIKNSQYFLQKRGWKVKDKFICLLVRDDNYLKEYNKNIDWNYHNYRDSDIETYTSAIEYLVNLGYWVIRMGKSMNKPISLKDKKVIDYPFCNDKSDLLDIWLFSNCHACITTGSGPDALCLINEIPMLNINHLPINHFMTYAYQMSSAKKHINTKTKKEITLTDILIKSDSFIKDISDNTILLEDHTSEEILNIIKEFISWINNEINYKDNLLQKKFWKVFYKNASKELHNFHHPKSVVSQAWLESKDQQFLR